MAKDTIEGRVPYKPRFHYGGWLAIQSGLAAWYNFYLLSYIRYEMNE